MVGMWAHCPTISFAQLRIMENSCFILSIISWGNVMLNEIIVEASSKDTLYIFCNVATSN